MIKHHVILSFRNMRRNKFFSFINIIGFAIGLTCCILFFLWVQDELGYDTFHENADEIHRIIEERRTENLVIPKVTVPNPLGPALKETYSQVIEFTRYQSFTGWTVTCGEKFFQNDRLAVADPSFFKIFSFPFIKGNPKTAFNERYSVVITEDTARKYFGDQEPMNKVLNIGRRDFRVSGIIKSIPRNSHLQFSCIFPIINMTDFWHDNLLDWRRGRFLTYIQLQENTPLKEFNRNISAIMQKNLRQTTITGYLQPLTDIHLYSDFDVDEDNIGRGNITYLYAFSLISLCILLVACINFMNLSTARSSRRALEIGIKKIAGAHRGQLIAQVFVESSIQCFIALVLAIILAHLFLPVFNELAGKELTLVGKDMIRVILGILVIACCASIIASSYPAFYLSSFQPIKILSGNLRGSSQRGGAFRKALVVIQFTFTIALIIGTIIIYRQFSFMKNRDLGLDKDNMVYFSLPGGTTAGFITILNELKQNPDILKVCQSQPPIYLFRGQTDFDWEGKDPTQNISLYPSFVDYNYAYTFGMKMVKGRFFSVKFRGDRTNFVLNETAVKTMGLKSPVGTRMKFYGTRIGLEEDKEGTIIGVIKDYHQTSLHSPIPPMVLILYEMSFFTAKIAPTNVSDSVEFLNNTFKKFAREPNSMYYRFFDELLDEFYKSEHNLSIIIRYFTLLAIFISYLGLLGLTSFITEQRTKEIGIRKVLGASAPGIFVLLTQSFMRWVLLANIIAWPLAWYFMNRWLQNFAYRIGIQWWIFLLACGTALIITLITISYQSIKAAYTNPVDTLKYE